MVNLLKHALQDEVFVYILIYKMWQVYIDVTNNLYRYMDFQINVNLLQKKHLKDKINSNIFRNLFEHEYENFKKRTK